MANHKRRYESHAYEQEKLRKLAETTNPEPFLFINPGAYWSHRMGCYARIRRSDIGPKYGVYKKYRRYAIKKARHYKGDLQGNDYRKLYDIIWLLW